MNYRVAGKEFKMLRFPQFKFSVLFIMILFLLNTSLLAQENQRENSLEAGAWALQFQISRDFTLSQFEGSVISAKRHFSDKKSLRFGLSLNAVISDTEQSFRRSDSDTLRLLDKDNIDNDSQNIALNVQYLFYPSPGKDVNLFWGVGPIFGFNRTNFNDIRESVFPNPRDATLKRTSKQWSLGVLTGLGAEWFATKSISFLAEYGLSLNYIWSKNIRTDKQADIIISESENTTESFSISAKSVKFGLSVYF